MSYEEKYKQALERMKSWANGEHPECFSEAQKAAEFIFPELAESEDEKIRKEIMQLIQCMHDADPRKERWIAWLEKQGEQTTDKIEPKFKIGDWVILNGIVAKILDKQKYGFVGLDIDGKDFFCNYGHTDSMRLWSINDAKDGDILVNGSNIFIFHFINGTRLMGYCHVNTNNGRFYDDIGRNECFCLIDAIATPATKEQRDLLFKKMKEAGYEWSNEKKELKKI